MPITIGDHRWLAQDDLRDGAIQNIAYQLGTVASPGSMSTGLRFTNTTAVAIAATETLIVAVPLSIPFSDFGQTQLGTLNAGTRVRATISGTYTSAGAQTATIQIRAGVLGTTSDASVAAGVVSVTTATSGTAIPFQAIIGLTIRTLGVSGTCIGESILQNQGTTGIFTSATPQLAAIASSTIATTTATFLDFTMTAGTSNSASIVDYLVEILP